MMFITYIFILVAAFAATVANFYLSIVAWNKGSDFAAALLVTCGLIGVNLVRTMINRLWGMIAKAYHETKRNG